ncbi:MAG: efflux RND transporter periplasmic adaptor subunit [Burkholderiales bacterium]|nr:MAG: efflux RND transporter periplasmic adaptor subunit [Burkholderiales bacterium]
MAAALATASTAAAVAWADTGAGTLASAPVRVGGAGRSMVYDGTVEAVRQTVVAAQVPGAVVAIDVRAGDTVRAGQALMRIDARSAEQTAAAGDAQVAATRATLEVARRELERQRQLFDKAYISRAALERAEAQHAATRAQLDALIAQAGAARTQSGLHRVLAPYSGVVAEVPVALGDMAMPGRALLTLYDPAVLRVTAAVPQSVGAHPPAAGEIRIELPGAAPDGGAVVPTRVAVLPTVDAATRTVQLRLELPAGTAGAAPGGFARVRLPAPAEAPGAAGSGRLFVPVSAVVRRAELAGLYVIDPKGRPLLRQVRLGPVTGDEIEVLAGLSAGDRVALDPQAAARVR